MKKLLILIGILLVGLAVHVQAEDSPTTAPTSQPSVISAGDKETLDANIDKDATVEGTVSDANWTPSGKVFLIKFKDAETSEFAGAIFSKNKDLMEKALGGDLTPALGGAKVQLHGKIHTFHDHPEIIIDKPEQITILVKGTGPTTEPALPAHTAE
jgi:hypothetical protein